MSLASSGSGSKSSQHSNSEDHSTELLSSAQNNSKAVLYLCTEKIITALPYSVNTYTVTR